MHKVFILGNLGRDPEMRYTPSGTPVTNINVASNRVWKDDSGTQHKETVWFRISFWGKVAEVINQHFNAGDGIWVEGRMKPDPNTGGPRIWTRQDGTASASYEVHGQGWSFTPGKGKNGNGNLPGEMEPPASNAADEEEIPF